ncbi:MAG: ATP-binding protein [Planctomycetota bacterium]
MTTRTPTETEEIELQDDSASQKSRPSAPPIVADLSVLDDPLPGDVASEAGRVSSPSLACEPALPLETTIPVDPELCMDSLDAAPPVEASKSTVVVPEPKTEPPSGVATVAWAAIVAGLVVATIEGWPAAIAAFTLTASATYLTTRRLAGLVAAIQPASATAERPSSPETVSANVIPIEIKKLRLQFELLLERHVVQIHRELNSKKDRIEDLEAQLAAGDDRAPVSEDRPEPPTRDELDQVTERDWKPEPSGVDIATLVRESVDGRRARGRLRGVRLTSRIAAGIGNVETDEHGFQRIVDEVLEHALGRAPDHTQVTVSTRVHRRRSDGTDCLVVRVRDAGSSFDEFDTHRLFDAESPATLGLAIARAYADALGGSIEVDADTGTGGALVVELPVGHD